jgi:hypothetical protein
MTTGTFFAPTFAARADAYVKTEILHYEDGRTLVNSTKTINREPSLAVSRVMTSGGLFTFWNDHDPRIVAVELVFKPA